MLKKLIASLLELAVSNRALLTLLANAILWALAKVGFVAITSGQVMLFLDVTLGGLLVSYGLRAPGVDKDAAPIADKLLPPNTNL